jgi:hypothetical protein
VLRSSISRVPSQARRITIIPAWAVASGSFLVWFRSAPSTRPSSTITQPSGEDAGSDPFDRATSNDRRIQGLSSSVCVILMTPPTHKVGRRSRNGKASGYGSNSCPVLPRFDLTVMVALPELLIVLQSLLRIEHADLARQFLIVELASP